jgi:hypothetical protein
MKNLLVHREHRIAADLSPPDRTEMAVTLRRAIGVVEAMITRHPHATLPVLAALAVVAAALPGCDDDFSPYNRLDKLRVLAVQGEPVDLRPGGAVTLTPLIHAPTGHGVTLRWSWCPLAGPRDSGWPCLLSAEELSAALGIPLPPSDLGTGGTAALGGLPAAVAGAICAGRVGERALPLTPRCDRGLPLAVRLEALGTGPDGATDQLVAFHTLYLRTDAGPDNRNPSLGGLLLDPDVAPQPITDDAAPTVALGGPAPLGAVVDEAMAERYPGRAEEGEPPDARERLVLTWFVEVGETRFMRTSFQEGTIPWSDATRNRWDLPPASEIGGATSARLIVVVRDHRGGVGWRSGRVQLAAGPGVTP